MSEDRGAGGVIGTIAVMGGLYWIAYAAATMTPGSSGGHHRAEPLTAPGQIQLAIDTATSGCSKVTSKRASTRSRTRPSWQGRAVVVGALKAPLAWPRLSGAACRCVSRSAGWLVV